MPFSMCLFLNGCVAICCILTMEKSAMFASSLYVCSHSCLLNTDDEQKLNLKSQMLTDGQKAKQNGTLFSLATFMHGNKCHNGF